MGHAPGRSTRNPRYNSNAARKNKASTIKTPRACEHMLGHHFNLLKSKESKSLFTLRSTFFAALTHGGRFPARRSRGDPEFQGPQQREDPCRFIGANEKPGTALLKH